MGTEPCKDIINPLLDKYLDLDPYLEAKDALRELRGLGSYKLAVLSNGSAAMLSALMTNSHLGGYFDATISLDGAKTFKPPPDCYVLVGKAFGVESEEVLFVSSNGFDVVDAKHFSFKVAWVYRGGAVRLPAGPVSPAQIYRLLRSNAETLGYQQDYTISALTELPGFRPAIMCGYVLIFTVRASTRNEIA